MRAMARYRKKPVVVEAVTFDEFVEYGRLAPDANIVSGMPWSFTYKGWAVTHENDDCYLIPTLHGYVRFERNSFLITGVDGDIYPCDYRTFVKTYEPAESWE
jgi:hypothetical protein